MPVSVIIVLANFAGNSLTIIVIAKTKALHKFCNFLLINLASSDILVGLLEMIGMSYCNLNSSQENYENCLLFVLQKIGIYIFPLLQVSLLTITAIAFDRYLAVSKPFHVMQSGRVKYLKVIIPFLWVMGFVLASPILIAFSGNSYARDKAPDGNNLQVMGIVFIISSYLLPIAVLIGTYIRIIWILKHRELQVGTSSQGTTLRTQKRASRLLGTVILAHNVCFFPYAFVTFVASQPFACKIMGGGSLTAYFVTYYIQLLSTANNSFIYFFHSKVFRDACKAMFIKRKRF